MNRRVTWWLSVVPLMLAGVEGAHWLAFRLVYRTAEARSEALAQTGHGYLDWLPALGGVSLALLACGALLHGRAARRGRGAAAVPARLWRLAALPPLAFVLQEHLERLLHGGTPFGAVLEPTFPVGLLLQLPFALLAYLAARLLLRVAERVGRTLAGHRSGPAGIAPLARASFVLPVFPHRVGALAGGHAERGPPV